MPTNAKDLQPRWRPNFCNPAALPDIKVVRTNFLINFVSATAALVMIFFVLEREYRAHSLNQEISRMEQQVQSMQDTNKKHLGNSAKFRTVSSKMLDLERFYDVPLEVHELVVELAKLRPDGLVFNSLVLGEIIGRKGTKQHVEHRITLAGEVEDPILLSEFKETIQNAGVFQFQNVGYTIDETLQSRNIDTGIFPYRLSILLSPQIPVKPMEEVEG